VVLLLLVLLLVVLVLVLVLLSEVHSCRHTLMHAGAPVRTFVSLSTLPCSACKALRIPNATLLSYSVWYAASVMRISSLTRRSSNPRSAQLTVTCRISSSAGVGPVCKSTWAHVGKCVGGCVGGQAGLYGCGKAHFPTHQRLANTAHGARGRCQSRGPVAVAASCPGTTAV